MYMDIAAARRIALVEEQIDHDTNRIEARRTFLQAERFKPFGNGGRFFGPRDALLHGLRPDNQGAGDLVDRNAGNGFRASAS